MKVKLRVLSPLHVGSGQEAGPLDYFVERDLFCRIDVDGLFRDAGFVPLRDKFLESAQSQRYIGDLVPRDLLRSHIAYQIPLVGKARRQLGLAGEVGKTVVKLAIKTAGRVYIPGSSIKGAILSAVCWRMLSDGWERGFKDDITAVLSGRADLLEEVLGRIVERDGKRDMGRFNHWLDVSDSDLRQPGDVLDLSLAEVQGSRRGQIPILYETVRPNTEFEFELKADPDCKWSASEIIAIVGEFYRSVSLADDPTASRAKSTQGLIRLGQGSGAFATSLLLLAQQIGERRYEVEPPRTRKRVDASFAMGWAQINETTP
jgi:CRISPR type III-A-associated RAMP protein Csm5